MSVVAVKLQSGKQMSEKSMKFTLVSGKTRVLNINVNGKNSCAKGIKGKRNFSAICA